MEDLATGSTAARETYKVTCTVNKAVKPLDSLKDTMPNFHPITPKCHDAICRGEVPQEINDGYAAWLPAMLKMYGDPSNPATQTMIDALNAHSSGLVGVVGGLLCS